MRAINILKLILQRENFLEKFQRLVRELNTSRSVEVELKDEKSDKSVMLYSMMNELKLATDSVCRDILSFLGDYRKYFGKTFIFEGTVTIIHINIGL